MLPPTLVAARKPGAPHRCPGAAGGRVLRYMDRLLVTLCLLTSVVLLYRCLVFTGGLLPFGPGSSADGVDGRSGGTTVIAATATSQGTGNLVTELVIDRFGRTRSTTVTQNGQDMSITVLGSDSSLRSRRAALRRAAVERQPVVGAAALDAGEQEQEPEAYPGLPRDFDAQAYLMYHPDLRKLGMSTADEAKQHYLQQGRAEGRPYKRLRVLLRYTACTGLINQHYSHIAAFTLAAALGAELVLPPAVCRDSFAHYFRMEGVYLRNLDLADLMERARMAVVGQATSILRDDPAADLQYVVLDMPCSFFSLRSLSNLPVVTEVAKSLVFAPELLAMADRIVDAMTEGSAQPFNGLHLRIEKDARDWATIMGGQQASCLRVVWKGYISTMRSVGFNSTTRIYVASGMLTYGASVEMDRTKNYLMHTGVCSRVHHKEQYIPQKELEVLNSEQKALLDFLVLARAQRFAGFGSSTFSFYLREYRALHGIPRSTSALVDAHVIGTDNLFHTAGTIVWNGQALEGRI
ncbi:hypothetical protein CHLNCDRAFT_140196 [Chlorella variabilis]|uniref:O-fucosyltransferase family protein n=1 Tax=Chlorella variabilis TaxID=554065 RepID=E1ZRR6_CHLVA|nr:hypothetical protein CHLNCDRAFT_140196 [Chlorella variabilis]EFN51509.1 hypothetical protein CHLNCDRAFT_140196 [Chlorella variabilis]|eukprot:XP_005843611.1 hypothetical protein CHLNCDRAFT_140196 [Chlorella variabilis]